MSDTYDPWEGFSPAGTKKTMAEMTDEELMLFYRNAKDDSLSRGAIEVVMKGRYHLNDEEFFEKFGEYFI